MISSSKIDRKCIAEAVLPTQETLLDFSAGCVIRDEISLPSIQLEEIGNMNIPLSLLDAERIKVFSVKQFAADASPTPPSPRKHTFKIGSDKIHHSTLESIDISSLVIKMLGLPVTKTMDFKAKLDKLMLFEVDGQYTHTFDSGREFGTFGAAILQLPVNGGHEGGNFHVEYNGRKASYGDQFVCDQLFSLTSFYNGCECVMNPVTRGWKLTLVFNLVWTNSSIVMPADFLVFLDSQKKLGAALMPWLPQRNEDDISTEVQQLPLLKENIKIPVTTSIDEKIFLCSTDQQSAINVNNSSDSYGCSLIQEKMETEMENSEEYEVPSDSDRDADYCWEDETDCYCDHKNSTKMIKCEEEDVLFFVLEEKYFENSLMFHHLQGNDRILADLLRCCPFIDVHLAKVTHTNLRHRKSFGTCRSEEKVSTKISRWVDSNGAVKDLNIDELNWNEKCVGPIRNLLEPRRIQPDKENKFKRLNSAECNCRNGCSCWGKPIRIRQRIYLHSILVIWPKHQSTGMYCRYGLGMLLNDLESSLTSALGWQTLTQQQLAQDLNKAVEYCCTYPQRIWTQSTFRNGELTLRLIRLCIAMRARKEGLEILKILGSEFEIKKKKKTLQTFEGIQNEQVAQAVVQFVCQSNDWDDCSDLIKGLITSRRVTKQFVPITKMIQYFLDVKCVKGATLVGDCVASSMANIDRKRAAVLKESDVALYVGAIVSLEAYPESSSQERLASLVSVFSKLPSTLQCRLMLELDAQVNSRFMDNVSCQFIFLEICETFLNCELSTLLVPDALGLLKCFILLENPKWLESLLSKMINVPDQEGTIALLKQLLSDQSLWKLATSSELGKTSLISILNRYSTLLFDKLLAIKKSVQSLSNFQCNYGRISILSSVTKYFQFVMQMKRNPKLADLQPIPSISLLLSQMNFDQIWNILEGFHKSSSERWNSSPCYSDMMREICKFAVSAMKKSDVMQQRDAVSNMVRCFLNFLEKSSSQSLLMEVCVIEAAGCWPSKFKYEFFSDIISSTEVWGKLDSVTKLEILNTCATLIESWIIEECNKLDENSWILKTQEEFSYSIHLFFLIEEHRFDPKQKSVIRSFQPYLKKLPRLHLRSLMFNLHKSMVTTKPYVKEFPLCLELFTAVCRHFFSRPFLLDYVSKEDGDKIVNCLLLIDDARSWERFANKICSFEVITDDNQPFQLTFLNANIQEDIAKSPLASAAFVRIADNWVSRWKSVAGPSFTWSMPNAVIPNHPEVEYFLRSSKTHFTYPICIEHLREFKKDLHQTGPLMKFSVSVSDWNPISKNCRLEKTKEYHKSVAESFRRLTSEMNNVQKFRQSLSQNLVAANSTEKRQLESVSSSTTSDEVLILSPKRSKLNISSIDLTI